MNSPAVYPTYSAAINAPMLLPQPPIRTGKEQWQTATVPHPDGGFTKIWRDGSRTWSKAMLAFIARNGMRCHYCERLGQRDQGPDGRLWHKDHVLAKSKGGKGLRGNLVLCCSECNILKGVRPVEQFMRRRDRPGPLTQSEPKRAVTALLNALNKRGNGATAAELVEMTEMPPKVAYEVLLWMARQEPQLAYAVDSWFDFGLRWFAA